MKLTLSVFVFMVAQLLASHSFAWGAQGHRLVCDIAWQNLESATKKMVRQAAQQKGYKTFAEACNWADHIRSEKAYKEWLPRHYMNQPREAISVTPSQACKTGNCVAAAIANLVQTLQPQLAAAPDLTEKSAEQLLFLGHFVGDLHQPLHVSYADDRGGNDRTVLFFHEGSMDLHWVWDNQLLMHNNHLSWRKQGRQLASSITHDERVAWQNGFDYLAWADESFQLTRDIYAHTDHKVGQAYYDRYYGVIEQRLKMAGVRLAGLLNGMVAKQ